MASTLKVLPWLYRSKINADGKTPIYLRLTKDNQRIEIATGYFIKNADWNSRTHLVKSNAPKAKEINEQIRLMQERVAQIHQQLIAGNKTFTLSVIKNKLTGKETNRSTLMNAIEYHNDLIKKGIGRNYAIGTYKAYCWFADKVRLFLKTQYNRTDIMLSELNHRFLTEFQHFLYHVLHNQVNTVQKNITQLRKVVNMCLDLDWLDKMPFKRIKSKSYTPQRDYLSADELSKILSLEIPNPRLYKIRDMFIFQCYTGVAFIDLMNLTRENVIKGIDGEDWLILYRKKTNSRSTIPLLPIALKLINKYHSDNRDTLFPVCSNQKYNMYIKEIGSLCDIPKRISSHTGRRTFATTVTLSNGVPIETVSRMLGHCDLKTTAIYAKVVDTKVSKDMERLKKALAGTNMQKIKNELS